MLFIFNRREFIRNAIFGGISTSSVLLKHSIKGKNGNHNKKLEFQNIVVIGAGLSGLCAAYELSSIGHNVAILEARNRVGGRVETQKSVLLKNDYIDTGAKYISNTHFHVINYAREFDLILQAESHNLWRNIYFIDGIRILSGNNLADNWPFLLSSSERRYISYFGIQAFLNKILKSIFSDSNFSDFKNFVPKRFERLDEVTLYQLLRNQGVSNGAISLLRLGALDSIGDGIDTYSALSELRSIFLHQNLRELYTIKGGSSLLPNAFARRLEEKIIYEAQVFRIEHSPENTIVSFQNSGEIKKIAADRLICTIPFSILKNVEIFPQLSEQKKRAIHELAYTSVARIFLQFKQRFWENSQLSGWGFTDLPIMYCINATNDFSSSRGVLECFISGPSARQVQAMDESTRLKFALSHLEQLFPGSNQYFERGFCKCWDEDPWSRGAYSWFRPGQMTELLPHIAKSEGRIHFAGDHTSMWPGFMQGALDSGKRVAMEVSAALNQDSLSEY